MNVFFAHSGGVTAVVNAVAAGFIQQAQANPSIDKIYIGKEGILGLLNHEIYDVTHASASDLNDLKQQPASAFGSCRFKLPSLTTDKQTYMRLIENIKAYNIGAFFYNGGNDSQDTTHKLSIMAKEMNVPLICIGLPKTIDNDLVGTDCCPGFGSAAKYIAISIQEASLDIASMCGTSSKVFILETMGRHAGWLAASGTLGKQNDDDPPHITLIPELVFEPKRFCERVRQSVEKHGYCSIVASEGIRDSKGQFVSQQEGRDAFGHQQLGGVAPTLSQIITQTLGYKTHYAIADYLQRSAGHCRAQTDVDQAFELGRASIKAAMDGHDAVMMGIKRTSDAPYAWETCPIPLIDVANQEKMLDESFIQGEDIDHKRFQAYAKPLIQGESYPRYQSGMPDYRASFDWPLIRPPGSS